jgi:site-specific recombinase XerD
MTQADIDKHLEGFREWSLTHRRNKTNSAETYYYRIRPFLKSLPAEKNIEDVNIRDIEEYLFDCLQNQRKNTARVKQVAICNFYQYLYDRHGIPNITLALAPISEQRTYPNLPEEWQIKKMIYSQDLSEYIGRRNATMILLMAQAGLRLGEVSALNVGHIQFRSDNRQSYILINVPALKSDSRTVPLGLLQPGNYVGEVFAMFYQEITIVQSWPRDHPLFVGCGFKNVGHRMSEQGIRQAIQRIMKRCKLSGIHPHLLRHWFATEYYSRTKDILSLKELLGHRDIKTTERYIHIYRIHNPSAVIRSTPLYDMEAPPTVTGFADMLKKSISQQSKDK